MYSTIKLLGKSLPKDHSRQTDGVMMAIVALNKKLCKNVLDVGCGTGDSYDLFTNWSPGIKWVGVDIENSPEVTSRTRTDLEFHSFDGKSLPFDDSTFDMVFSKQVLEHVRHPSLLMSEMARVLKPGGLFVGSTSQLEPYHSYSLWNYTPYGFKILAEDAGFLVSEIRPSIDAFSLMLRRLIDSQQFKRLANHWWNKESPLNALISFRKKIRGTDETANAAKLLFCGQFSFFCIKKEKNI